MTALSRALACHAWIVSSGGLAGAGQGIVDERGDTAAGPLRRLPLWKSSTDWQALELHVDVGVNVDGAGQQIEARDVDLAGRGAEAEAEARDPAALDADVRVEGVAGPSPPCRRAGSGPSQSLPSGRSRSGIEADDAILHQHAVVEADGGAVDDHVEVDAAAHRAAVIDVVAERDVDVARAFFSSWKLPLRRHAPL